MSDDMRGLVMYLPEGIILLNNLTKKVAVANLEFNRLFGVREDCTLGSSDEILEAQLLRPYSAVDGEGSIEGRRLESMREVINKGDKKPYVIDHKLTDCSDENPNEQSFDLIAEPLDGSSYMRYSSAPGHRQTLIKERENLKDIISLEYKTLLF